MSNSDFLNTICKPWLDKNDIMKIANCGDSSARKIIDEICSSIIESGKKVPPSKKKIVPTQLVLNYLSIDVNFLVETTKVLEEQGYVS